jgi:nucleotide-binding universal stress UspA family protein
MRVLTIRRILFASDFSRASSRAFATATTLAKTTGAALFVAHVVTPVMQLAPDQFVPASTWAEIDFGARSWADKQLATLTANAKKKGVRAAPLLLEGSPAEQVVRAARSKRADLIVLGTHGRKGFSKFFLGSVAERVVATATCPVVTVRGK